MELSELFPIWDKLTPDQQDRILRRYGIQFLACGHGGIHPTGLIPTQALDPFARFALLRHFRYCFQNFFLGLIEAVDHVILVEHIRGNQRMDVAVLLQAGANYQTISQEVNVSTATISRVSKCLNYGSGGYRDALAKLKPQEEEK